MKIKYLNISLVLSLLFLSACNFSKPLEWVYYDRVKFTFISEDEETDYIYLCTKEATEQGTKEKASKANKYFSEQLEKITEEFAESVTAQMMAQIKEKSENGEDESDDDFSFMDGLKATMKLQNQSEQLSADVEEKFQCLLIDSIERE